VTSNENLNALRVTQAYVWLLATSIDGSRTGMVSLARIRNFEIRMFAGSQVEPDGTPPIWMELFDCDGQVTVDSCICHEIEDALTVLEDFTAGANNAVEAARQDNPPQD
jgi:hypothetical protein